uniref:Kunitz-type protease inhibitor 1-like protein n=1 Tax=Callorhinchus milii TaxID=7868 RepID=V9KSN1_CALMI
MLAVWLLFLSLSQYLSGGGAARRGNCLSAMQPGKPDFVLDTDDSVKAGATFLQSPNVSRVRDCVRACCSHQSCNLALVEDEPKHQQGDVMLRYIRRCFLFDCLYNQAYVCRFFRRDGYRNFILDTVYESYMKPVESNQVDRKPIAKPGYDRTVQPDENVVLSGLESRDDHDIIKYDWILVEGDPSVGKQGTKNPDEIEVTNLKVGLYVFQLTVTDSIGQNTSANISITVLSPAQSLEHCMADVKVGLCRGAFPRWAYNGKRGVCEKFTYGGCKGNQNNYVTEKECWQACNGVGVEKKPTGRAGLPHCTGACSSQQFKCSDGCCIDASLECDKVDHCNDHSDETSCQQLVDRFGDLLEIDVSKEKVRCVEPPMTGSCRAHFIRFYYNPYQRKCERFTYGGCNPNGNNFQDEHDCMLMCRGVTEKDVFSRGLFERQGQKESNAGVAILIVLAICILVVLAVLGYYLMKMRKKRNLRRQQPSAASSTGSTADDTKKLMAMDAKPV